MLGSPEQDMDILEHVQCRATRMITGLKHMIREKMLMELEKKMMGTTYLHVQIPDGRL